MDRPNRKIEQGETVGSQARPLADLSVPQTNILADRSRHEAETIVAEIEKECGASALPPLPPPAAVKSFGAAELFRPVLLPRLILGSIVRDQYLIFGFVTWLPTCFVQQDMTLTKSFAYTLVMSFAAPIGCASGSVLPDRAGPTATVERSRFWLTAVRSRLKKYAFPRMRCAKASVLNQKFATSLRFLPGHCIGRSARWKQGCHQRTWSIGMVSDRHRVVR